MKVVSFDVGLRNLAYCVLEGTSRSDVKIVDWNIIDILGEQAGVGAARCHKCETSATYEHASNGTFSCRRHVPKKIKTPTKVALNKLTPDQLRQELASDGLVTDGTKKADLVKLIYNHRKQNTWKKCVSSATGGSVLDLASSIIKSLDLRHESWAGARVVCLENQMDRRMFGVQAMLQMYFCCRGLRCMGVSATHKLSNIVTVEDSTASYKGRKRTGIAHALLLVPAENQAHFARHPKKDDLADSFLQGLWVLEHEKK
jgi:Mitochondrial resolvase Ydc2 / RNA splicing MRS1